jgi:hypothetical protein
LHFGAATFGPFRFTFGRAIHGGKMFKSIEEAVEELLYQARRLNAPFSGNLTKTLKCGEFQKVLDNARKSTALLKRVRFDHGQAA